MLYSDYQYSCRSRVYYNEPKNLIEKVGVLFASAFATACVATGVLVGSAVALTAGAVLTAVIISLGIAALAVAITLLSLKILVGLTVLAVAIPFITIGFTAYLIGSAAAGCCCSFM